MHVGESLDGISEIFGSLFGGEDVLFGHVVEKSAPAHIFQNQIDVVLVLEKSIKFDDIRVIQGAVEPYFPLELLDHFVFLEF